MVRATLRAPIPAMPANGIASPATTTPSTAATATITTRWESTRYAGSRSWRGMDTATGYGAATQASHSARTPGSAGWRRAARMARRPVRQACRERDVRAASCDAAGGRPEGPQGMASTGRERA